MSALLVSNGSPVVVTEGIVASQAAVSARRDGLSVMRGALAGSFGASGIIQVLNVVTGVLLAHSLGATDRGELAAVMLWPSVVVTIGSLGFADAVTYYTARTAHQVATIVGTVACLWVVQSLILIGIGAVLIPAVLGHYGDHVTHASLVYLAYAPAFLASVYAMSVLQGLHRFRAFQLQRVGLIVLTALLLLSLFAIHSLSVLSAAGAYLVAYVLMAISALHQLRRHVHLPLRVDKALARDLVGFALRSHTTTVSALFNERLDQLIISAFLAPVQLGRYVVAVTMTSLTGIVGQSVSIVALPAIAAEEPGPRRTELVVRYVRVTLVAAIGLTVPLLILTRPIIVLCFGQSFAPATDVARVLLVAGVVLANTRVVQAFLKAAGRPLEAGVSEFVALGVTAIGLATLLPLFGILGAGIASLLAYAVSAGWTVRRASKALDLTVFLVLVGNDPRPRAGTGRTEARPES